MVLVTLLATIVTLCAAISEAEGSEFEQSAVSSSHSMVKRDIGDFTSRTIGGFSVLLTGGYYGLAGLTILAAFKLAIVMMATFYLASSLFPSLFGISLLPFTFRSLPSVGDFKNVDYLSRAQLMARSISSLPEKSFEYLDIKENDCRARAVCEMGEFMADKIPSTASWVQEVGDKFMFNEKYTTALIKGIKKVDCGATYNLCPISPLRKMLYQKFLSVFR